MLPSRRSLRPARHRALAVGTALAAAVAVAPMVVSSAPAATAAAPAPAAARVATAAPALGKHRLVVDFDSIDTVRRGAIFAVSGTVGTAVAASKGSSAGVPASFTLTVTDPTGDVLATRAVTTTADGSFATTVPASVTRGIGRDVAALAVRADDVVDTSGRRTADGGAGAVALRSAGGLEIDNSFVSSVGWVKPGQSFPSTIRVTNPGATPVLGADVTVTAPTGSTFLEATPSTGTRTLGASSITWTIPAVPAATTAGPGIATLVLENRAALASALPTIVWRDLSSTATLSVGGASDSAVSHGPKVIPPSETFDTARYGDRPFPIIPVQYNDRSYLANHSGETLAEKINSPDIAGSTFNLYQEMSLGQLFPDGTVPSAGIATADFTYGPGFDYTKTVPGQTCTGTTYGDLPVDVSGTPAYPARITDGVYNLPGQTQYYGADSNGSAVVGSVAGVGALQNIDSGCGPTGKLVADAAGLADPEIDYSDYDTDKDGVVDFFMVVYAGCGGNGASQIPRCTSAPSDAASYDNVWPHSSSLEGAYKDPVTGLPGFVTDDQLKDLEGFPLWYTDTSYSTKTRTDTGAALKVFVRVGPYNVNPETAIDRASVISHEYGHSLGLPDFYSTGSRETYGDWNLMATDKSQHMDAFSRQELGWVVPDVLAPGHTDVTGFKNSKFDTGAIHWQTPDGTPYTLENGADAIVHNSQMYVAKLPGRTLLDRAAFTTGAGATPEHLWWSGSGNDFGCAPTGGRNFDLSIPGLATLPAGTPVKLSFKSRWNIEWDFDYGFVLTTTDGGSTYKSHASKNGYTTSKAGVPIGNPNMAGCLDTYDNGITGTSGSYAAGTQAVDRVAGNVPDPVFLQDSYDISDLAGAANGALRFSYATDPGLALPGWFIDDVTVTATVDGADKVIYSSDFETTGGPGDAAVFNGGCKEDLAVASTCTKGWKYLQAGAASVQDHAYYLEMRDRSGFDFDGHGENDRDPIGWDAGLYLAYTDEAHGYGNAGTDDPPAQSPLDSVPTVGSATPNLNDAAFTATPARSTYTDASATPHVDNYADPTSPSGNWTFDYDCLGFEVNSLSGAESGPVSNLTGDVSFDIGSGCGTFDYGYVPEVAVPNTAPTAAATATPSTATTGQVVTFSGADSTDAETPGQLDYSWDFGDGSGSKPAGQTVEHAFTEAGTYQVELTVLDPQGLPSTATIPVTVTGATVENTAPTAVATATPSTVGIGQNVELSPAGTTDAQTPDELTYSWNFGNGGTTVDAQTKKATASYAASGAYTATVTVTDPQGLSDTATAKITVTDGTPPGDTTAPVIEMRVAQRAFTGVPVVLDARGTSDDTSASTALTYSWSKGDGGTSSDASGSRTTVKFAAPGSYRITLKVTDEAGNSSVERRRVQVLRYLTCNARSVTRQGAWKIRRSDAALRGVYCDTSGRRRGPDQVIYSFTGDTFEIVYGRAADGGSAEVFLDGKMTSTISFTGSGSTISFRHVRRYTELGAGRHTVRIARTRGTGYLEGFVVHH